jgi:sugar/nucleoside kinase (ribokinase family)
MSKLIVVGDVMVDITAMINSPLAYASDAPGVITQQPGGAAANTAAWAAYKGCDTVFIGSIGQDQIGINAKAALEEIGVDARLVINPNVSTGSCICIVDKSGERTMIPDQGANAALSSDHLTDDLLVSSNHLHISGYTLLQPTSNKAGLEIIRKATENGLKVSIDPSSASMIELVGVANMRKWLTGADIIFPNIDELNMLTGNEELESAVKDLLTIVSQVVVTLDQDGALFADKSNQVLKLPAPKVAAIDATGAGDAFAGGYLANWLQHHDPAAALAAGIAAGSECVTQVGARPRV